MHSLIAFAQTHVIICFSDVPKDPGRYLGAVSGMAEYIEDSAVLYCRHSSCWKLTLGPNKWRRVRPLKIENGAEYLVKSLEKEDASLGHIVKGYLERIKG